jgi:hypothetical protein
MTLGILLIATPLLLNAVYFALAATFSYPGILREPTDVILRRFSAGGSRLVLLWWLFALSALLFLPVAVLAAGLVADPVLAVLGLAVGVVAGLVQALGLIRWVFLVPFLARAQQEGHDSRTVDLVFQSFHRYLGVAVGEHLGYLTTGAWSILFALGTAGAFPLWSTIVGVTVGAMLLVGSLEFVGPFERHGWKVAGVLVTVGYLVWSAWLIVLGVLLLLGG